MTNLIIACLLSGVASLILGSIWYHKKVFGTAWMDETGMTDEKARQGNMPLIFGLSFLITAYMAYSMKWVNHPDEHLPNFIHGMFHGAMHVGVFAVGAVIINALYEQRSPKLIFITAGYWLVLLSIIGGILASFPSFKPPKAETETEAESTGMKIEVFESNATCYAIEREDDTFYLS